MKTDITTKRKGKDEACKGRGTAGYHARNIHSRVLGQLGLSVVLPVLATTVAPFSGGGQPRDRSRYHTCPIRASKGGVPIQKGSDIREHHDDSMSHGGQHSRYRDRLG